MSKVREKIKLTSYDELLKVEITDGLKEIDVDKLHDFSNHPFKVSDDEKMEELTESIRERGVLLPILVRKTNDEEYEIISGHRRTHAARLAGIEKVPVIIRELSDDDATIVMVDSNIQREEILPSEKAYAFQMKLEAIQHKGIKGEESREVVGEANGLSGRQVSRYIKLTNLLPELLEMVDEKKIAIKLAVEIADGLKEIDVDKLHDFSNHPFKVSDDEKMEELTESIRERGVLLPILVRKTNDEEYEIISGHRRTHAARLAGIEKVPVIIRELSDDDATIVMVDSNIQREEILPSEKAYAFQMKLEAIQHKGIKGEESREVVGEANGLSGRQVSRYIKLTNLLPELLEMVDEKKIAIKLAVEIAELSESEQQEILDYFNLGYKVSLEQVKAIKNKEKSTDIIERSEEKTQQSAKVTISRKKLKQYFPENYTKAEMENIIYQLLEKWKSDGYDI